MVKRTQHDLFVKMSAGLVLIGIVGALNIDNQLTVIKNDCFERLAIGQRLNGRDIYNTLELNTVPDCQRECTKDEEKCRSFSFGIGVKGNASCELSSKVVKETVDLKPVGTLPDADFDLYIKKLGCKLVIEQKPHFAIPKPETHYGESGSEKPTQDAHESYVQIQYTSPDPAHPHEAVFRPDNVRPSSSDFSKAQQVQTTLISIRPDPKRPSYTGLGPALGYFDSRQKGDKGFYNGPVGYEFDGKPVRPYDDARPNSNFNTGPKLRPYKPDFVYEKHYYDRRPAIYDRYDKYRPYDHPSYFDNNRPPFRPPHLNYPYNDKPYFRPGPGEYDPGPYRPRPDFDGYGNELPRPDIRNPRPDRDRPRPDDRPRPGGDIPTTEGDKLHLSLDKLEATRPRPIYDKSEPTSYHNTHRPEKDFYYEPSKPMYDHPLHQKPNDHAYDESSNRPEHQLNRPIFDMNRPMDRPDSNFNRPESNFNRPMGGHEPNYRPMDSNNPNYRPPDFLDRPRPHFDRPEYIRPFIERPDFNPVRPRPPLMFDYNMDKPKPPYEEEVNGPMPDYYYDRPMPFERPMRYGDRPPYNDRPLNRPHPLYERPDMPIYNLEKPILNNKSNNSDGNYQRPIDPNNPNVQASNNDKPVSEESDYDVNRRVGIADGYKKLHNGTKPNQISDSQKPQQPHDKSKPIISQSIGPHGETITSIITEIKSTCFRRALAGKRVSRSFVKRVLNCERIEDCQEECSGEKRFNCEIFNFRLDARGSGECELSDLPLVRLDMVRDIYSDEHYDVYERDRNGPPSHGCKGSPFAHDDGPPGPYADRRHDHGPPPPHGSYLPDREPPPPRGSYLPDREPPPPQGNYPPDREPPPPPPPHDRGDRDRRPGGSYLPDREPPPPPHDRGDRDRRPGGSYLPDREPPPPPFDRDDRHRDRRPGGSYLPDREPPPPQFDRDDRDRRPGGSYLPDRREPDRRGDGYNHYSDRDRPQNSYLPRPKPQSYLPDRPPPPPSYIPPKPRPSYLPERPRQPSYLPERPKPQSYLPKRPPPPPPPTTYIIGIVEEEEERNKNHWGVNKGNNWGTYGGSYGKQPVNTHRNDFDVFIAEKVGGSPDWGRYGGTYGTGGIPSPYETPAGDSRPPVFVPPYEDTNPNYGVTHGAGPSYGVVVSYKPGYGPDLETPKPGYIPPKPSHNYIPQSQNPSNNYIPPQSNPALSYVPPPSNPPHSYVPPAPPPGSHGYNYAEPQHPFLDNPNKIAAPNFPHTDGNVIEHKVGPHNTGHVGYNYLKDECSLRTATGFRLHKVIVKKYFAVPSIYECELLCFKESKFECLSYAYRYTATSNSPSDNCYLSNKSYKDLDFYTDLEPDRDFDIYTMNNRKKCIQPLLQPHQYSDCFWHQRSGQRFDTKIVRDSYMVKTVVDCQLECLKATKFLCRGFSFRYGSPIIGGPVDNCLLTDWPFSEVDMRSHFVIESGFEIYERGSFGHGCEPNHFNIRGKDQPVVGSNTDQCMSIMYSQAKSSIKNATKLCYVGYGQPARLLPQSVRKSVYVNSELDCKEQCTKARHSPLNCMSFSFRQNVKRGGTNCDLSDVLQRDLLNNVDYVPDPDSWLFAWDNYNPECISLATPDSITSPNTIGRDDITDITVYTGYDPSTVLDTWKVYSVSGWPCKRGTFCKENRAGRFWYCELEGGQPDAWDYCCRPDHQCGYSAGFQYQWCYVGPANTQWRKCSEQYFPYIFHIIDSDDFDPQFKPRPALPDFKPAVPDFKPIYGDGIPPFVFGRPASTVDPFIPPPGPQARPNFRPNRPPAPEGLPPFEPSLEEFEQQFNMQFLDPPKPGGFISQPRYWPVSYLHNEGPPGEANSTMELPVSKSESMMMPKEDKPDKFAAIQNLIQIIKSNDINNVQYEIDNTTKMDEILLVKIPLPTNFTDEIKAPKNVPNNRAAKAIDSVTVSSNTKERKVNVPINRDTKLLDSVTISSNLKERKVPLYRKGTVTRTNVTNYGRN